MPFKGNQFGFNMKTPKFLLCENPIAEKSDGRIFILHTQEPIILAEVYSYEGIGEDRIKEISQTMSIGARLDYGLETFFFVPNWLQPGWEIIPEAKKDYQQITADKLAGVMRRMADWYKAYLIWEDNQDRE